MNEGPHEYVIPEFRVTVCLRCKYHKSSISKEGTQYTCLYPGQEKPLYFLHEKYGVPSTYEFVKTPDWCPVLANRTTGNTEPVTSEKTPCNNKSISEC